MKRLLSSLAAAGAVVACASVAHATTLDIAYTESSAFPPAANATNSGPTLITSGATANFFVSASENVNTTVSGPLATTVDLGNSSEISTTGAGTVYVYVSAFDVGLPVGSTTWVSSFTSNAGIPAGWTVSEATFLDLGNTAFAGAQLGSPTQLASITASGAFSPPPSLGGVSISSSPFSIAELFIITATSAGAANLTIDLALRRPE